VIDKARLRDILNAGDSPRGRRGKAVDHSKEVSATPQDRYQVPGVRWRGKGWAACSERLVTCIFPLAACQHISETKGASRLG
jgi:hypothetical protein